jgi:hypothetical protein
LFARNGQPGAKDAQAEALHHAGISRWHSGARGDRALYEAALACFRTKPLTRSPLPAQNDLIGLDAHHVSANGLYLLDNRVEDEVVSPVLNVRDDGDTGFGVLTILQI